MIDKIEEGFAQLTRATLRIMSLMPITEIKNRTLDTEYQQGLLACKDKNIITSHAASDIWRPHITLTKCQSPVFHLMQSVAQTVGRYSPICKK